MPGGARPQVAYAGDVGWLFISGILLVPLVMALWAWLRNRRLEKELYEHSCPLCGTHFDEVLPTVLGPVTQDQALRLDRFQRRFAGSAVQCRACGAVVLCSTEGFPMRGYYPERASIDGGT